MLERIQQEFEEWWESILEISPSIILGVILFVLFVLIGKFAQRLFVKRFDKRTDDKLLSNFLGRLIFWTLVVIGLAVFLKKIGLGGAVSGLLAGAGVTAVVLGFAFKDIGENLLAGILLAFSRPFSIGDVVEAEGFIGTVKFLHLKNTHIRTSTGKDIYIPNALILKNPLINYTQDGLLRHNFTVGIDYNENLLEVISAIEETLSNQKIIAQSATLKPFVIISEFGTSTVNLGVHFWTDNRDVFATTNIKSEIMQKVIKALIDKGFSMPADIIELKIYQEDKPIPLTVRQEI